MTHILFEAIDEIFSSNSISQKKIILFGLNAPAFACKQYLQDKGIEIFAYVDNSIPAVSTFNNPNITPTFHHMIKERRITAYKPEALPLEYRHEYVFLLYSKYESEMIKQLEDMGYRNGENIFVLGGFWKTEDIMKEIIPNGAGKILTWEEEKLRQIKAVKYVFQICEDNGLRCFLNYGTLLGAARHRGYIPWDDDMDLAMPVADMNKLLEILIKENGQYGVYYSAFQDPCRHFIAKIEDRETVLHQWDIPIELIGGMVVDIFPLGGLPGNKGEALLFYDEVIKKALEYDNLVIEFPNANDDIIYEKEKLKRWILDAYIKYPFDEAEFVFTIADKPGRPRIFPKKIWDKKIPLKFEGEIFWGPAGYNEYLSIYYGDYMTLPLENRRVSIHRNRTFQNLKYKLKDDLSYIQKKNLIEIRTKNLYTFQKTNKKLLAFSMMLTDFYTYGKASIVKLNESIEVFGMFQDEIQVIWIMEEQFNEVLFDICPELYDSVKKLIKNFKDSKLGEIISIDNTAEVIKWCDGYYGSEGYVMYLAQEQKIPVMISNIVVNNIE